MSCTWSKAPNFFKPDVNMRTAGFDDLWVHTSSLTVVLSAALLPTQAILNQ